MRLHLSIKETNFGFPCFGYISIKITNDLTKKLIVVDTSVWDKSEFSTEVYSDFITKGGRPAIAHKI